MSRSLRLATAVLLCCTGMATSIADPTRDTQSGRTESTPASVKAERELLKNPDDAKLHLEAARAYLAEADSSPSKRDAAAAHVQRALEKNSSDVDALILMGQIELQRNRPAVAALHLQNAARLAPDNPTAQLSLGDALSHVGDEAGASAAFAEYRRIMGMPPLDTRKKE